MRNISVSLDGSIEANNGDLSWSFPGKELHQHFNDREAALLETRVFGLALCCFDIGVWKNYIP